jgi:hypothetical protein
MLKRILWAIYAILSLVLLIYLIMPGPSSIDDFSALPSSNKSSLEGDTVQVANISAYFSNNFRDSVIPFYSQNYQAKTKFFFPPLRLNYPPEDAYSKIKDQTYSTYLEELTYPLRDSLYINGLEPVEKDGQPRYIGAGHFEVDEELFDTKVTLRYYPSSLSSRIITWVGINLSVFLIVYIARRIIKND